MIVRSRRLPFAFTEATSRSSYRSTGLEQQIDQVKAAAVFVGKSDTGPWQQEDKVVFLRDFQRRGCPILPVLLPGAPSQTPQLPLLLEGRAWIDFRQPETDPLSRLVQGISG